MKPQETLQWISLAMLSFVAYRLDGGVLLIVATFVSLSAIWVIPIGELILERRKSRRIES